jgi:hypothetical protein
MHVRGRFRHVEERRCPESTHVLLLAGDFVEAAVAGGVGAGSTDVVEAGVVELELLERPARVGRLVIEDEAAVTVVTFTLFVPNR